METVTLNNGVKMPLVGYGVFQLSKEQTADLVFKAIKNGYRLIDTAQAYFNEEEVGQGIKKAEAELGVKRADLFLTTKVWITSYGYDETKKVVEQSLKRLQTDYLDLVLLHDCLGDYYGAYRALEDLYHAGKIRAIGISNFSALRMADLAHFNEVTPAVNQVESHLYFQQDELHAWMKKLNIQHEAWGPLAEVRVKDILNDPLVKEIAAKHGKTPAQVALRQLVQRGIVIIPKTTNEERMKQNLDLFDFQLSPDEMTLLKTLDEGHSLWTGYDDPRHLAEVIGDTGDVD